VGGQANTSESDDSRRLSVVVPVYNEARRLPTMFSAVDADADAFARAAGLELLEIIVVDDGSTDATAKLLDERKGWDERLRVMRLDRNRGKGAAVRRGVLSAAAPYVLVTDVDLSTPLSELVPLTAALDRGCDLAIGSRAHPSSRVLVHQPRHRELMGKSFNALLRMLTGLPYRDTQCGFKLFRLETTHVLFEMQRIDGFAFDAELCVNATALGLRIAEVPVAWIDDLDTKVTLVRSSARMARDLVRIWWRARHASETVARMAQPYPRGPVAR
jgi:dolichyl-phosphate beta-glucosyltransferase